MRKAKRQHSFKLTKNFALTLESGDEKKYYEY